MHKKHIFFSIFFPQACLVGFQNSGCEHKGNHSEEIPDLPGPVPIRAWSKWLRTKGVFCRGSGGGCRGAAAEGCAAGSAKGREPKLAVPYKGNRETFIGFLIGIFIIIN